MIIIIIHIPEKIYSNFWAHKLKFGLQGIYTPILIVILYLPSTLYIDFYFYYYHYKSCLFNWIFPFLITSTAFTAYLTSRIRFQLEVFCALYLATCLPDTWGQMRVSLSEFRKHISSIFLSFLTKPPPAPRPKKGWKKG